MLTARTSKLIRWVLLLSIISAASAQEKAAQPANSPPQRVEYKSGQVWRTDLGATITVLAVEELRKFGKVVHIRVDNIPVGSCGGVHLTTTIPHIALTEKMMQKAAYAHEKDNVDLPDSYLDEYRKWVEKEA